MSLAPKDGFAAIQLVKRIENRIQARFRIDCLWFARTLDFESREFLRVRLFELC